LLHTHLVIGIGAYRLDLSLHHWINDGLMALFFFVVGLEIKREFIAGELADWRNAMLPIVAAIGGMLVPALLYTAINHGTDAAAGWGIPMATDIAFAISALVILGNRVPKALVIFLVTLAIVDDLGAVAVIALFYTDNIATLPLAVAGAALGIGAVLNLSGVQRALPYAIVGVVMWMAMLASGVHATIAGVLTAFTIPARPKLKPEHFALRLRELAEEYRQHPVSAGHQLHEEQKGIIQSVTVTARAVQPLLQRSEHLLHLPVSLLVLPLFALANAAIPLDVTALRDALTSPIALGVIIGLVGGKVIGITLFSWLAIRAGIARPPRDASIAQIAGVGLLGGIGFTMSIFISELAFRHSPADALDAKVGILFASLIAGFAGFIVLHRLGGRWLKK
jgi:NhaA family Na+:H+ antiporter